MMVNLRRNEREKNIREKNKSTAWVKNHRILKTNEKLFPFCTSFILDLLQLYSNMLENHTQVLDI